MLATTVMLLLAAQTTGDLGGGTQPGTLTVPLQSNNLCAGCHASTTVPNLALDTYRGTMMHLASEDPFFLAAWEIAFDDDPEVAGLCLRCHFPNGYLADRHEPHDGSSLVNADKEGIQCDLCHRMVAPEPTDPADPLSGLLLSNTQVFVANSTTKHGPYGDALTNGHANQQSALFTDSRLCAQCHEVTNTLSPRYGLDGATLSETMPIERTYTEWKNSAYAVPGADFESCMDCHMAPYTGKIATSSGAPDRPARSHRLVGGNTIAPKMMQWLATQPGASSYLVAAAPGLQAVIDEAVANLQQRAATLEAISARVDGATGELVVRVTNTTGHKLPTGYAEGRRMFLSSVARSADGEILARTGTIDPTTQSFVEGEGAAKLWQIDLGLEGEASFHFAKVNQIVLDSRIPPKGFRPTPDTAPVDATVEELPDGTLAHWDDVRVPLGETDCFPVLVDVVLQYQTASGEYFRFLVEKAPDYGPTLQAAWDAVGGGSPVVMRAIRVAVHADGTIEEAAGPYACEAPIVVDAGVQAPVDAGGAAPDAGGAGDEPPLCACATTTTLPSAAGVLLLSMVALLRRRR